MMMTKEELNKKAVLIDPSPYDMAVVVTSHLEALDEIVRLEALIKELGDALNEESGIISTANFT